MEQPTVINLESSSSLSEIGQDAHSLVFEPAYNGIMSGWAGFVSKKMLIKGGMDSLNLLSRLRYTNLLVDHRNIHGTWADMSDWEINIWLPNALQAGLTKYALVAYPGSYSVMAAESLFLHLNTYPQLEMMIFSDVEEAKKWLNS